MDFNLIFIIATVVLFIIFSIFVILLISKEVLHCLSNSKSILEGEQRPGNKENKETKIFWSENKENPSIKLEHREFVMRPSYNEHTVRHLTDEYETVY